MKTTSRLPAELWIAALIVSAACLSTPRNDPPEQEIPCTIIESRAGRTIQGDTFYTLTIEYLEPGSGATVHTQMGHVDPRMFVFYTSREVCMVKRFAGWTLMPCRKP